MASYILVLILGGSLFSGGDIRQIGPFESKALCLSARDQMVEFAVSKLRVRKYGDDYADKNKEISAKAETRVAGMQQYKCIKITEGEK